MNEYQKEFLIEARTGYRDLKNSKLVIFHNIPLVVPKWAKYAAIDKDGQIVVSERPLIKHLGVWIREDNHAAVQNQRIFFLNTLLRATDKNSAFTLVEYGYKDTHYKLIDIDLLEAAVIDNNQEEYFNNIDSKIIFSRENLVLTKYFNHIYTIPKGLKYLYTTREGVVYGRSTKLDTKSRLQGSHDNSIKPSYILESITAVKLINPDIKDMSQYSTEVCDHFFHLEREVKPLSLFDVAKMLSSSK